MIKIIFVDINARYYNPTRELLPSLLALSTELHLYGPGYVDSRTLKGGLTQYLDRHAADLIVLTEYAAFAPLILAALRSGTSRLRTKLLFEWNPVDFKFFDTLHDELKRIDIPKVVTLLESDFYSMTPEQFQILQETFDYYIGFGTQFCRPIAELKHLRDERFAKVATDLAFEFFLTNNKRTANLTYFVSEAEFEWKPLALRANQWAVPGVLYARRARVVKCLRQSGRKVATGRSKWGRLLYTPHRFNAVRSLGLDLYRDSFRKLLSDSRYVYTCGSGLNYPVRKYFEIPAAGCVLVATPCSGFSELGFVDCENVVVCEPQQVNDVACWLERNLDKAQNIADSGRQLIATRHSVAARARQFADTLAAMADRSFAGGRWVDGRYTVIRRKA